MNTWVTLGAESYAVRVLSGTTDPGGALRLSTQGVVHLKRRHRTRDPGRVVRVRVQLRAILPALCRPRHRIVVPIAAVYRRGRLGIICGRIVVVIVEV